MKSKPGKYIILSFLIAAAQTIYSQPAFKIEGHFKALSAHDVKAIAADYSDSAKVYSPNWEGIKKGQAGITEVYTRYFKSTPDLTYEITRVINAGNNIIVEYVSGGTLSDPEDGTPAYMKNKKYLLNYCAIFTIEKNKIVRETDYFDQVSFLRQVGFFDQK